VKLGKASIRKLNAADADLVLVFGYGDYNARIDVGRLETRDGWLVKKTKLHVWQNLKYGIFSPTKELLSRSWTH
jgi:hypothetical protein